MDEKSEIEARHYIIKIMWLVHRYVVITVVRAFPFPFMPG